MGQVIDSFAVKLHTWGRKEPIQLATNLQIAVSTRPSNQPSVMPQDAFCHDPVSRFASLLDGSHVASSGEVVLRYADCSAHTRSDGRDLLQHVLRVRIGSGRFKVGHARRPQDAATAMSSAPGPHPMEVVKILLTQHSWVRALEPWTQAPSRWDCLGSESRRERSQRC